MPLKLSAFPKCFIDQIAGQRSLSVFDWIEMARALDADGLEMYDGFFISLDTAYLDRVGETRNAETFGTKRPVRGKSPTHRATARPALGLRAWAMT